MEKKLKLKSAEIQDIQSWMALVDLVKDNFPGLETPEGIDGYRKTLLKNIQRETALCVTFENCVVGILLYSYKSSCLSCMAVHPDYRRLGIASMLVEKMIDAFPIGSEIGVSTFREGDPLGMGARELYKKFGFIEGELTTEFDYPNQKFRLTKS